MKQTKYYCLMLIILLSGCGVKKCLSSHAQTITFADNEFIGSGQTANTQEVNICDKIK